jgi:hypothetical protein
MGHITDEAAKQLAADANGLLKRVPSNMRRDLKEHLKVLAEFPDLDPGEMPETRKIEKSRDQRDEAAAFVWGLLDQFEDWEAQQPVDHGPIKKVTQVGNPTPEGDRIERIYYEDGTVEEHVAIPAAVAAELEATMKSRVDRIHDAKADLEQADQLGALAAQTDDAAFRERAGTVRQQGRDALDTVRNEIVEELRGRGFTEPQIANEMRLVWEVHYDPLETGVPEALELAKAGKVTELYDATVNLGPDARYQLTEKLDSDPDLKPIGEELLKIESERIEARAKFARDVGMI